MQARPSDTPHKATTAMVIRHTPVCKAPLITYMTVRCKEAAAVSRHMLHKSKQTNGWDAAKQLRIPV